MILVCGQLFSQAKTIPAIKADLAPKIDGALNDEVWKKASVATDFIQNSPTFGLPATQKTEVRVLYDDAAIYVVAYLYDDPALIRKQLTSRDAEQRADVDYFSVFFDTYNDRQNGFQFLVTSANIQSDARISAASNVQYGEYGDKTWDAVWVSKVSIQKDGWVVEMKIPYISLRFSKKQVQDWGIQFLRLTRRNNEISFWNPVDPSESGFVNQFGQFKGLENIQPPLRLSFSPYVSGGINSSPQANGYLTQWLKNGGMDVKYGISESFTLDATLIPDFAQVVSDNDVNNLTPFEIRFNENRQFFTEGTELFNKAGLFYSRRIGAIPGKYNIVKSLVNSDPNLEMLKNPVATQLYNATKFSGRTRKKLGIGIFNAVTAPMHALYRNKLTQEELKFETESLTNYNILVMDQSFRGRSYVTFTNTNVMRNGNNRNANVSAIDFAWFDKRNVHSFSGYTRYSKIFGSDEYDGFNTRLRFAKVSGKVQYSLSNTIKSDKYDPNDLGYNLAPNAVEYNGTLTYNQFTPTAKLNMYNYSLNVDYGMMYKPFAYRDLQLRLRGFWLFKNFWDISYTLGAFPTWQHDYFELRTPGMFLKRPWYIFNQLYGSTDSRKKLFVNYGFEFAEGALPDNPYHAISLGVRYRFNNKFLMELSSGKRNDKGQIGYAFVRETNGDPIVGIRNYTDITSILSGQYNFPNRLNLTMRARHYWSKVLYKSFHNVTAKGDLIDKDPSYQPNLNQNFNLFNLDAFLTWDFRLGSRLVIGWKKWLGSDERVDGTMHRNYISNLGEVFNLRHGNEFTVRFIYFIDYNQLNSDTFQKGVTSYFNRSGYF